MSGGAQGRPAGGRPAGRLLLGGLLGSATLISGLTVAARLAGFGRTVVFSHEVGAACVGNTYTTANLLPNVLFEVAAGGALAAAVVPVLAAPLARAAASRAQDRTGPPRGHPGGSEVDRIASGLLTWVVLLLAPLSLALALAATPLAALTLPAPTCPGQRELAATMIVVFAPQVLLYGVGAVLAGVLQAQRRFGWPALAPLLSSAVVMLAYAGYARSTGAARAVGSAGPAVVGLSGTGLAWLAGGTTLGVVVMTLPLAVPVARSGVRLRPTLALPDGVGRRAAGLATAGIAGLLAQQGFVVVTLLLANSRGRTDTLNVVQYVQTVSLLPYAVLAVPVATAAFPRLAERAGTGDRAGFAALSARSTRLVLVLGAAGAALVAGTAPAVAGFFVALDRGTLAGMDGALTAAAPGLMGLALIAHLGRALYAVDRGRSAAGAIAAGWLAAAVVATVLVRSGVGGARTAAALAAAGSVGVSLAGVALLVALRRTCGAGAVGGLRRTATVGLLAALLAGAAGRAVALAAVGPAGTGPGLASSLLAAALAALVVALVLAVGIRIGDPDLLRGLRTSADPATSADPCTEAGGVLLVLGTSAGGVGRHVAAVTAGLLARGDRVAVAAPAATLRDFGYAALGAQTFAVPISDRPRPLADLRTAWRLHRLSGDALVLHAHGLRAGALAVIGTRSGAVAVRLRRPRTRAGRRPATVPVVVTLHNALVGGGRTAVAYRILEWVVARGADQVLVVSGDLGTRMRELGARRVDRALVPAGDPPPADPAAGPAAGSGERATTRAELGVPDRAALLLAVARLAPQKGLDVLLEALAGLPARARGGVLVVIAGDGPLREQLAATIARNRLPVRLLGRRDDVPALLRAADLVLVPSRWEGQPLIVQEALRAGAAIVATDAGGTAELAGDAVRLVPAGDAGALRAAVVELLDSPGQVAELRARALVRAATLPTATDAVDQLVAVYARLAGRRAPAAAAGDRIR